MPRKTSAIVPASAISPPAIETRIHQIRGLRVMLDRDLAEMYGVDTKILNKAVSRNASRFPADFSFVLTPEDLENLRFQFGTSRSWGGRRHMPRVFTEQGVAMLSTVLRSRRANGSIELGDDDNSVLGLGVNPDFDDAGPYG